MNNILLSLLTEETGSPSHSEIPIVTADEVKSHLRITGSSEDTLIESYIESATDTLESYLGMNFINGTYTAYFDYCDCVCGLEIRQRPFQSISSITYWDGIEYVEISSENYVLQKRKFETFILFNDFKETVDRYTGYPIKVEFVSGFGEDANLVPQTIKTAVILMVSKIYESRGDCGPDCPNGLCLAKSFVRKYKPLRIGSSRSNSCGCLC